MTVQEAKAAIFDALCSRYHKSGESNHLIDAQMIGADKNIPDDVFDAALKELKGEGDIGIKVELSSSSISLRLGAGGVADCQRKQNRYR